MRKHLWLQCKTAIRQTPLAQPFHSGWRLLLVLLLSSCGMPTAMPTVAPPTIIPSATASLTLPTTTSIVNTPTVPTPPTVSIEPSHTPTATPLPLGWSLGAADGPSARFDHSAVFDSNQNQLLIFGGRGDGIFNDTWAYDLATGSWHQLAASGPEPRFGHGAVFDAATNRLLIVMGQGQSGFFNDVWALDRTNEEWIQLQANLPDEGPRPRYGQSAALDDAGRVWISHGFSDQGRFDDTWAFDLATASWRDYSPDSLRPLKRCLHELSYDAKRQQLLLFGGCSSGFGPCPQGDLWAFDLTSQTWSELTPIGNAPTPRSNPSMQLDSSAGVLWLFGGLTTNGASNELWRYTIDSNTWLLSSEPTGPSARSSLATGRNPATGDILLFGGLTANGTDANLWLWHAEP